MKKAIGIIIGICLILIGSTLYFGIPVMVDNHRQGTKVVIDGLSEGSRLILISNNPVNASSFGTSGHSWLEDQSGKKYLDSNEIFPSKFSAVDQLKSGLYKIKGWDSSIELVSDEAFRVVYWYPTKTKILVGGFFALIDILLISLIIYGIDSYYKYFKKSEVKDEANL